MNAASQDMSLLMPMLATPAGSIGFSTTTGRFRWDLLRRCGDSPALAERSGSLHHNQRQVAVHGDFRLAPHCDVVQRPLAFEPREGPLYSLSLVIEGSKARQGLLFPFLFEQPRLVLPDLNYRLSPVLSADKLEQFACSIGLVGHHMLRMKLAGGCSCLGQDGGGSCNIEVGWKKMDTKVGAG